MTGDARIPARAPSCHHCQKPALLVFGDDIYPHRPDLYMKRFYVCRPCAAWVGCHPAADAYGRHGQGDGSVPLGTPANAALRALRHRAHLAFDPMWKSGQMTRRAAYQWLADQLKMERRLCHIGHMGLDQCDAVLAAVADLHRGKRRYG